MQEANQWSRFNNGQTIGEKGSECGIVVQDEEHMKGARVTIEKDGVIAPFSVTIGIYGLMFHTAFAGNLAEAESIVSFEKEIIQEIFSLVDKQDETSNQRVHELMEEMTRK